MHHGRARIDYCPSLFAHRAAGVGLIGVRLFWYAGS
jgi:hypothetical protein